MQFLMSLNLSVTPLIWPTCSIYPLVDISIILIDSILTNVPHCWLGPRQEKQAKRTGLVSHN